MPNRHERRAAKAKGRHLARAARLRCVGCERVGQRMTNEHIWPLWLIKHAQVHKEGINWVGDKRVNPVNAKLPLCATCNHRLGSELEAPVSQLLPRIERGAGLTDMDAELLVRWLWKFESLFVSYEHAGDSSWRYSDRWTLIQRILEDPISGIRGGLTIALGLTHANDPEYTDWPMGIDSGVSDHDGLFVSGVFGRTALMVSLSMFDYLIPAWFGIYRLKEKPDTSDAATFFPPMCFPHSSNAVTVTKEISAKIKAAHEDYARDQLERRRLLIARPRLEIPG